jgi:hypothetical protein
MSDPITRRNTAARERATAAGHDTYHHEVVDTWPACTACGSRIRNLPDQSTYYRVCRCVGVIWTATSAGWRKITPPAVEATE